MYHSLYFSLEYLTKVQIHSRHCVGWLTFQCAIVVQLCGWVSDVLQLLTLYYSVSFTRLSYQISHT